MCSYRNLVSAIISIQNIRNQAFNVFTKQTDNNLQTKFLKYPNSTPGCAFPNFDKKILKREGFDHSFEVFLFISFMYLFDFYEELNNIKQYMI